MSVAELLPSAKAISGLADEGAGHPEVLALFALVAVITLAALAVAAFRARDKRTSTTLVPRFRRARGTTPAPESVA